MRYQSSLMAAHEKIPAARLCQRCMDMNLDELLRGNKQQATAGKLERKTYFNLGPANLQSFTTWCSLCQFFASMSPSPDLGPKALNQTLVIKDAAEESFGQLYSSGGRMIPFSCGQLFVARECVTASGTIYSCGHAFCAVNPSSLVDTNEQGLARGRLIEPNRLDYSLLRDWISNCKEAHVECIGQQFFPLKVIDCNRRTIRPLQEHVSYVALSYVWGRPGLSADEPTAADSFPTKLPATVEDAIKVTLGLGYDYLWVDRYCINQHAGGEKAKEIARMDEIYQGAEIVIIDAAGDDPALGLPGVSHPRSTIQPRIATTTHTLVSLLSYPLNHVLASKWATRGWTYQEGVLAKRRLFFTSDQVYFECCVYGCMETLGQALIHPPSGVPSIVTTGFMPDIRTAGTMAIKHYLRGYSTRELSYSSDALNAFRGIFHLFEKQETPVLHCGGVPILRSDLDGLISRSGADLAGFLRGLCWEAPWEDAIRRPGFPSWSWTGWECPGGVALRELNFPIHCLLTRLDVLCDDRTTDGPLSFVSPADAEEQDVLKETMSLLASSPGAIYMKGRTITFLYGRQSTDRMYCSGSATHNIWFEHKKNPARSRENCSKPLVTRFFGAGIPKGLQSLKAVAVGQALDPLTTSRSTPELLYDPHEPEGNKTRPETIILLFLLLRELRELVPAPVLPLAAPTRVYNVYERVGFLILDFPTPHHYETSDWFLEAVEEDLVIE
ncbi:HET-domain-containing protein [Xylariaceae sp. AK1471]|nr:HET-domain-containing protein [Xylariaceae sp. AK1471]